jgi:hypothetical protein
VAGDRFCRSGCGRLVHSRMAGAAGRGRALLSLLAGWTDLDAKVIPQLFSTGDSCANVCSAQGEEDAVENIPSDPGFERAERLRQYRAGTVARDRFDYITAISDSWKSQMLLNLVKIRYGDAPVFLDVA